MKEKGFINISEEEKRKRALQSTYEERFLALLRLIRISRMLKGATIIHQKPNLKR